MDLEIINKQAQKQEQAKIKLNIDTIKYEQLYIKLIKFFKGKIIKKNDRIITVELISMEIVISFLIQYKIIYEIFIDIKQAKKLGIEIDLIQDSDRIKLSSLQVLSSLMEEPIIDYKENWEININTIGDFIHIKKIK